MVREMKLRYVGKGEFIPAVPARDLQEAEIPATGYTVEQLCATGLYSLSEKMGSGPSENKMMKPERSVK